jgi:tetratricopeptide (TPR) repeat protein
MKPLCVLLAASLLSALPRARAQNDQVSDAPAEIATPSPAMRGIPVPVENATPSVQPEASHPPLEHVKPSVELIKSCRAELAAEPDGKSKADVLGALSDLENGAAQVAPEQRQGFIDGHLGGFNAAVLELDRDAPGSLALKAERNAAMLNGRADRWQESRDFAGKALARDPNDLISLVVRARANVGLQDYARAYADAARAMKVDPNMASAYTARAAAEYGMGQYLQALEDSKRALALDSLDATAFDIMKLSEGRTHLSAPNFGGGAPQVSDSVEREYHGMMQQLSQVEKSRQIPDEEIRPASVSRLVESAGAKLSVKDYWGALAETDKALAVDPSDARALYFRAAAHNLLGEYGGAVEDATKGLTIRPTNVDLLDARSWALDRMGRLDDAVADAHHALELDPRDAYALVNRAFADEQRRDYAAMLEDYRAAALMDPQFGPDYRDAARRHGLAAPPLPGERAPAPDSGSPPRARTFGVVLLSSLAGGLLIALGLLHVGSAVREERTRSAAPNILERDYEIGKPIGQGGMGVVYRGFDRKLKRPVALKTLRDEYQLDAAAKAGFLEEARTVAELHHPSIVAIYNIVDDPRGIALVFELLEGRPLDEAIAERGRLRISEIKRVLRPVCDALEYAHAHGVVHRDLKPSNVMLLSDGGVKVLDFGISRHAAGAAKNPVTQTVVGTPHYMAPEQEYGVVRKESDLFSLGTVLYEATTGARPFEGSAAIKLARGYRRASSRVPGLPRELDALIDRALEPDPDKRISSAAEFWLALCEIPEAA